MTAPLNIHPELQSIGAHRLPTNRWALAALQRFLSAVNSLHRRKFASGFTRVAIPGSDGYPVPAWIIRPGTAKSSVPALIYYHGGAFVMKPAPQHFENVLRYAREAECAVVFVEYRLAPKHPFPAGFNDCHAALQWTLANAESLGVDRERIAVGGDSAGGGLAAGVAQRALQEDGIALRGQLLIYPAVDLECKRPSISAYANVPPFRNASALSIAATYLGHPVSQGVPRYASPIHGDLSRLAPAYVEIAEFDLLHDQGNAYAQALTDQGVAVELNEIQRGVHGFDLLAAGSSVAKEAMQRRIQFLRRIFS
ncbi:MAG TPA: alpha/beta hydrolase fold domain-containing protein [Povalibacter sp.]|uniref:alpha/beta hydrolase n=1 Tax=Povalibacter sp. TaxID=1962978 RepID=UPI002CC8770F|nr:alpha/beta hydrolase fold domain-containing protein [Povalibacter sp.]HMN46388.1 alpha/beta hydrolase fold domain-containing protein [Povalibacter sp.]